MGVTTPTQRRAALQKANAVRTGRADLRARLRADGHAKAGATLATLIEDPPEFLHSMLVFDLLCGLWPSGSRSNHRSVRAQGLMRMSRVDSWAEVGRLTSRQRGELSSRLRMLGDAR